MLGRRVERAAGVCVIGRTVRERPFGAENSIGKAMRLSGRTPYKLVGTLRAKGLATNGMDQDDVIILPYTTGQKKLKGIAWLTGNLCSAMFADVVKGAGQQAAAVLRDR